MINDAFEKVAKSSYLLYHQLVKGITFLLLSFFLRLSEKKDILQKCYNDVLAGIMA